MAHAPRRRAGEVVLMATEPETVVHLIRGLIIHMFIRDRGGESPFSRLPRSGIRKAQQ